MQREELKVKKRDVLGKKVKKLRHEGLIPGNVYGKEMQSEAVELPMKDFMEVFRKVHETGLVDLKLDSKTLPVLIHNVQYDPKSQQPLHADFFKVNLKEKITAKIPVVATGEAKAETDKIGLLEQPVAEIEVEALPADLPEKIEVNVETLAAVDEQILVEQIKVPAGVTVLNEPSQVVFKIGELVTKEAEAEAAADEAAAETAATEGETTEGGEAKKEEAGEKSEGETKSEEAPTKE